MGGMGMGGMGMGGMGGMGGRIKPVVQSELAVQEGGDADLLGGLKGSNAANQNAKVMHLKQRQEAGQGNNGGMGGAGMF